MIKKSPKLIQYVNFGTFPGSIMFICGFTYEETHTLLKKKKNFEWLDVFETTKQYFDNNNSGFASKRISEHKTTGQQRYYYFIYLRDRFDFSDRSNIILAHEIIHICTYHLKDMLDIVVENEAFAYTHTHVMTQIYKHLRS